MSKHGPDDSETADKRNARRRLQTSAFNTLYRFGGPIYDRFVKLLFGDAWQRWRLISIQFIEEDPVLDLGSGTGVLVEALVDWGYDVIGIELEPSMLKRAAQRKGARNRMIRANARELPVKTAAIGSCISTFPAGFILQRETLDEVARVLRPGGPFAVVMSGETAEQNWWRAPIRLLLRLFYGSHARESLPDASLLAHPSLPGEWKWVETGNDRTLIWLARRSV